MYDTFTNDMEEQRRNQTAWSVINSKELCHLTYNYSYSFSLSDSPQSSHSISTIAAFT